MADANPALSENKIIRCSQFNSSCQGALCSGELSEKAAQGCGVGGRESGLQGFSVGKEG